jgi:ferric-dicitrate binding protein FerR (iron transport regulator)
MTSAAFSEEQWQAALDWLLLQHEQAFSDIDQLAFSTWINANVAHQRAYDEAKRVWQLTGLLPPSLSGD